MGFVIIPEKNAGYPFHQEMPEIGYLRELSPPYPGQIFRLHPDVEEGYPFMPGMTELCSAELLWLMVSDLQVSQGYPLCRGLPAISGTCYTKLLSGGAPVRELFFGDSPVSAAYFGGETVFLII